jgi:hypothetical protein
MASADSLGMPDLPLVVIPHPLGSLDAEAARARGRAAVDAALAALLGGEHAGEARVARGTPPPPPAAARLGEGCDDAAELTGQFLARGWGDGLPVIPPTLARVEAFVAACGRPAGELVALIPPRWAAATVEVIAANAVMAGCLPEHLPLVLAGVEAIGRPAYNLYGIQATTGSVHPLMVVGGPLAERLGIPAGAGCLGPGFRASAAIGRAIRMVLLNAGGALPGEFDRATQGQPGKFTMCFAENVAESPWPPFHVDAGCDAGVTVVLMTSVMGTQDVHDYDSTSADELLRNMAASLSPPASNHAQTAGNSLLMICPEHARTLAGAGLTRQDVQRELAARCQVRMQELGPQVRRFLRERRSRWFDEDPDRLQFPTFDDPEDLQIVVAGGPGKHSVFFPGFGGGKGTTDPQMAVVT